MKDLQERSMRPPRILVAAVALSFVFLVGSTLLVWTISRSAQSADELVVATLAVKQSIQDVLTQMTAAESGQRGYLLTLDSALLAPYSNAQSNVPEIVQRLRTQVAGNPPQVTRVDELNATIAARFDAMEEMLQWARSGRSAEAARLMRDRGERLMDRFRDQLSALDHSVSALLVRRREEASASRNRFLHAVAAMLISCGVLALFALVGVRRTVETMQASRLFLHEQNLRLEDRVRERTQALEQAVQVANRERARAESLLTDVNHRVGNNLALVSSFLTMQLRSVRHAEAARALDAARGRVQAIASAHRKLRLGADFATVRANEVLAAVVDDITAGLPPGDAIQITCDVAPLEINARDAVSLGVLTSELVMNAVKHAFGAGESGCVNVTFAKPAEAAAFIEVADNGVGWHEQNEHDGGGSLGSKIIDMVARQFGGRPERVPVQSGAERPGTRIRIELNKLELVHASG